MLKKIFQQPEKISEPMKNQLLNRSHKGFTLMETVIAIGVLAVLLTGFLAVFTPAAQGIRRSISSQQADRLTSTLERELVTLREGQTPTGITTGFEKAFAWLKESNNANNAIFVYQYRGDLASMRSDGTPTPMPDIEGQPGVNYTIQSIARRADDAFLQADLGAIEGSIFFVKPTQLVYQGNAMVLNPNPGTIKHLVSGNLQDATDAATYNDAVLAFSAEFYSIPTKSYAYLQSPSFTTRYSSVTKPVFTRNLAVRR